MVLLTLIIVLMSCLCADSHLLLSVLPFGRNVVLEENADLNLTCKVINTHGQSNERFDLTWKFPTRSNANGDRITIYKIDDQLTVTIHNLQEDDSGIYICELQNKGIIRNRKVNVFVRSKNCNRHSFACGSGLCVPKNYVCDGYVDCPSGFDESFKICGPDACHGKILCDGRCISKELCCDPVVDVNCSVSYVMPCCHGVIQPDPDPSPCSSTVDCHFGRIVGYGNSLIFVVASCAVIVIVVSAVVMFVACRLCSQRSDDFQRWSRVSETEIPRPCLSATFNHRDLESLDNVDFLFDDLNLSSDNPGSENFVLMNFVEGSGFQIADCGRPKPPPYTENTIGFPPPPYESNTNIATPDKDETHEESATENDASA